MFDCHSAGKTMATLMIRMKSSSTTIDDDDENSGWLIFHPLVMSCVICAAIPNKIFGYNDDDDDENSRWLCPV